MFTPFRLKVACCASIFAFIVISLLARQAMQPDKAEIPESRPAFPLAITCAHTSAGAYGEVGRVCVKTEPGAALWITVTYCSGHPAMSAELQGVAHADSQGAYAWSWYTQTSCHGPAGIEVSAQWNGETVQSRATFEVT